MSIIATNQSTGTKIDPVPGGTYIGRCFSMIHIGTVLENIQNKGEQWVNKVQITFELPTETHVFDEKRGAEPRVVGKEFTLSMNEKSNLRKFLTNWRGKPFTEADAEAFDITKLLSIDCMLTIINKTSAKGNIYSEITAAAQTIKGMTVPDQVNPNFEFNYSDKLENFGNVPKFLREKIMKSKEWTALSEETKNKLIAGIKKEEPKPESESNVSQPEPEKPIDDKKLPF